MFARIRRSCARSAGDLTSTKTLPDALATRLNPRKPRTKLLHDPHLSHHRLQSPHSNRLFEMPLHPIQNSHHSHRSLTSRRLQHQPKRPRILRIDLSPHQSLGLKRRDAVAYIATARLKRLCQLRRLNTAFFLEKDRSQHQRLEKSHPFLPKNQIQRSLDPSSNPGNLHDRTLIQESLNPHPDLLSTLLQQDPRYMVYMINYL